jgi:hypothetical protein
MSFTYYLETAVSAVDIWAVRETCEEKSVPKKKTIYEFCNYWAIKISMMFVKYDTENLRI